MNSNNSIPVDKAAFFKTAREMLDTAEAEGTAVMLSIESSGGCKHLSSADPRHTSVFMATMIRNIVGVVDNENATVESFEDYIHDTGVALDDMRAENIPDNVVELNV